MQQSTIVTINREGKILAVDKTFCRMFGYTFDELIGNPINIIIPSPYAEQHDTYIRNYLQTGNAKIIGKSRFVEAKHKDGCVFPVRLSVSKIGEGEGIVFIGMIDKLADTTSSLTINHLGIIVAYNVNTEELLGYNSNELLGKNVSVIMPDPFSKRHDTFLSDYMGGGAPKAIGKTRNWIAKRKDGTTLPVSVRVEELRVGETRLFRGRIERVDRAEAVFTLDEVGKILATNEHYLVTLFGYQRSELMGIDISTLVPDFRSHTSVLDNTTLVFGGTDSEKDDEERPRKKCKSSFVQWRNSVEWTNVGVRHLTAIHKDGSTIPVLFEIYPLLDDSNPTVEFPTATELMKPAPPCKPRFCVNIKRADSAHLIQQQNSDSKGKILGNYTVERTIGQGTYGKVKLATHRSSKEVVAIKFLQKIHMNKNEVERIHRETEILRTLSHPNIAKLIEIIETEDAIHIVMEYAGRTLLALAEKGAMPEAEARKIFIQLAGAVQYCHESKVIHRDLKHTNILLDDKNVCKLIDFGLSNFMEEGKLRSTFCGTPAYAAPEMILGQKYIGPEVDIWSLGIILFMCVTGYLPFENGADIITGKRKSFTASPDCKDLIERMLQVDVPKRITIDEIMAHPWVKENPVGPSSPETKS